MGVNNFYIWKMYILLNVSFVTSCNFIVGKNSLSIDIFIVICV